MATRKIDLSKVPFLLVDPNPLSLELTCDVLGMMGALTLRRCTTTDRALEALRSEPIDIVITEWNTAPLSGLQFIDYVRTSPQSPNRLLPILLMTARSEEPHVMQARDRGITEFLAKPFTVDTFYKRLVSIVAFPRAFIDAETYFGPDRRRRDAGYQGPDRRLVPATR